MGKKGNARDAIDEWRGTQTSVCLPADTVESNQAKQIRKADPGSLERKGCIQMKEAQLDADLHELITTMARSDAVYDVKPDVTSCRTCTSL